MPAKQQDQQPVDQEKQQRQQLRVLIGEHVLHVLGRPDDLCKVQVRQLWEGHYRVNVFVGAGITSARVAHSYFLVADSEGNIVASTPKIIRLY